MMIARGDFDPSQWKTFHWLGSNRAPHCKPVRWCWLWRWILWWLWGWWPVMSRVLKTHAMCIENTGLKWLTCMHQASSSSYVTAKFSHPLCKASKGLPGGVALTSHCKNCQKSKLSVPALLYLSKQLCHITHWAQQIPSWQSFSLFQQTTSKLAGSEPATNCKKSTDRQRFPSSNVRKLSDNCCWFRQHIQGVHLLFLKNFNIRQLLKKRC